MTAMPTVILAGRRALALIALVITAFAVILGPKADPALAAYTAKVEGGTLKLAGNSASDQLLIGLEPGASTTLQVDVGADGTADFSFDRNTFTAIDVRAGDGDDGVRIVQTGGAFADEAVTINGGNGADTLVGGIGQETLVGGSGNDIVSGGDGNDTALLGTGADRFTWNPGDDNDVVEGQGGDDRLDFNGSSIGEIVNVVPNGGRVQFTRNIANIAMDLDDVERVAFRALGGPDMVIVGDLAGTDAENVDVDLNASGGGGDAQPDTVLALGTEAADGITVATPGGDQVVSGLAAQLQVTGGEVANDNVSVATLGGDDSIATGAGVPDAAPINIDGGAGSDTARYNGTADADAINVVSNGPEATTIGSAGPRLDIFAVESLTLLGLGGGDTVTATGNLATLTAITMDGGLGDDTLRGGNGADLLLGGDGIDDVDGNQGIDVAHLGRGHDRFQWDPGDGNDTVEGQSGEDRLDFNGSGAGELIDISANGDRVRFARNIANIAMDLADLERLAFHAFGGSDAIVVNDLAGTDADNVLVDLGTAGGVGDGQPDSVTARGTELADRVTFSSPGAFPTISGLGAEVVVEAAEAGDDVSVATLGGDDTVTTGREVFGPATYNVDGGEGADVVRYNGTELADEISTFSNGAEVSTFAPLAARLDTIAESLILLGLAGPDTITATGNLAALTAITMDGGADADSLRGGNGADRLLGGDGSDFADGNQGIDRALLGPGDDRFQWDPGDGNDSVDGQSGVDAIDFFASNAGESMAVSPNGSAIRIVRNIGNVTMDADNVENLTARLFGGADLFTVNALGGTDVDNVDVDLNTSLGVGDALTDSIVVNGSTAGDTVAVSRSGAQVLVNGLAALTRITGSEPTLDALQVNTLGGNDDVAVAPDVIDLIATAVDLGDGE